MAQADDMTERTLAEMKARLSAVDARLELIASGRKSILSSNDRQELLRRIEEAIKNNHDPQTLLGLAQIIFQTDLEIEKLKSEEKRDRWSKLSVVVPILGAIITAFYGLYSIQETARLQLTQKAAELVMQGPTRADIIGRGKLIDQIFPTVFDEVAKFPDLESKSLSRQEIELKQYIHKELSSRMSPKESFALWRAILPGNTAEDDKIEKVIEKLPSSSSQPAQANTSPGQQ